MLFLHVFSEPGVWLDPIPLPLDAVEEVKDFLERASRFNESLLLDLPAPYPFVYLQGKDIKHAFLSAAAEPVAEGGSADVPPGFRPA